MDGGCMALFSHVEGATVVLNICDLLHRKRNNLPLIYKNYGIYVATVLHTVGT